MITMLSESNQNSVKSLRKELDEKNLKLKEMYKTILSCLQENNHLKDEIEALKGDVEDCQSELDEKNRQLKEKNRTILDQQARLQWQADRLDCKHQSQDDDLLFWVKRVNCLNKELDEKKQQLKEVWDFRSILNYLDRTYFAIGLLIGSFISYVLGIGEIQ